MKKFKVLTLVGGISQGSINKKLYRFIESLGLDKFEFEEFDITTLPYFSQDLELDPPDAVTEFKELIRETHAALFITPEYNRSIPGVLKNAIDWGSRPYGQNIWAGLPAGILGASVGNVGTFGAQHHLRQVLSYLDVVVMNQPEFYLNFSRAFNENGQAAGEMAPKLLRGFFAAFSDWVLKHGKQNVFTPTSAEIKDIQNLQQ